MRLSLQVGQRAELVPERQRGTEAQQQLERQCESEVGCPLRWQFLKSDQDILRGCLDCN